MPFPTSLPLLDDFNRADNASLGANWTEAVNGKTNSAEITHSQVSVAVSGPSSMAAYTAAGGPVGKKLACQDTATGLFTGAPDALGLGVTLVSDTTKGFHTELDLTTTDLVTAFLNDSTGATLATVTATGFGQLQVNDMLGLLVEDSGTSVSLEQWIGRAGAWTPAASTTASGAQYLAGPYYPALRVKYDTEFLDDFRAGLIVSGRLAAAQFVGF